MFKKTFPCILLIFLTFSIVSAGTREVDPELAQAAGGLGERCALVIGVEYATPYTLDWTAKDAEMIAKTLETVYGFDTTLLI